MLHNWHVIHLPCTRNLLLQVIRRISYGNLLIGHYYSFCLICLDACLCFAIKLFTISGKFKMHSYMLVNSLQLLYLNAVFSTILFCLVTVLCIDMWPGLQNQSSEPEHKKLLIFLFLLYHNLVAIYTIATNDSSLLQNLMGFLLHLMDMRYYILNMRY